MTIRRKRMGDETHNKNRLVGLNIENVFCQVKGFLAVSNGFFP
jgi:hypothetical protein